MKLNKNTKILIVGLGLLGGSYAMALTKEGDTTTMRQMMRTSTERRKLFDKPQN